MLNKLPAYHKTICLAAGLLGVAALPPYYVFPVLFISFGLLLYFMDKSATPQTSFCLRLLVWFRLVCLRPFLGRQRLADRRCRFRMALSAYAAGRRRLFRPVCRHSRRIGLVFQKHLCPLAGFRLFLGNFGMDTQFHLYRLSVEPARFCSLLLTTGGSSWLLFSEPTACRCWCFSAFRRRH